MKTIMKFTAIVAFMFTTMVGLAKEPKLSIVSENDIKSLVFELDSQSKETLIQFMDANDEVLYSESIDNEVYLKKFNLKKLKDGFYYFLADDSARSILYKILLEGDDVKIVERKENAKPVFRTLGDKVFLNLLNLDRKDVEIKVYDSESRVVYKETLKDQILVEKAFNFEKAYSDNYTLVIKDGSDIYYENIVVN
ncbi:MAG: hypothetical protein WBM53_07065 [Maribacter sp.]